MSIGTAGKHDVDGHAAVLELLRVPRRHGLEAGLARAIRMEAAAQHGGEAGGDVDDPSPALRQQVLIEARVMFQAPEKLVATNRCHIAGLISWIATGTRW